MDDPNSCNQCICKRGFQGELVEPFCRRPSCVDELRHGEELSKKCAPVYFVSNDPDKRLCCPYKFICRKYSIVSSWTPKVYTLFLATEYLNLNITADAAAGAAETCVFGGITMPLGTVFQISKADGLVYCKCDLPPYVTCRQNFFRS